VKRSRIKESADIAATLSTGIVAVIQFSTFFLLLLLSFLMIAKKARIIRANDSKTGRMPIKSWNPVEPAINMMRKYPAGMIERRMKGMINTL
jgi:hypothetical protein